MINELKIGDNAMEATENIGCAKRSRYSWSQDIKQLSEDISLWLQ